MVHFIASVVCFLASLGVLQAQVVYVHGALQGGPIAGVHIRSTTDGESCVSDAFGRFDLSAFAESDTLLISHLNYSPMQVVVGAIRSGPQPFTIALLPEERSLEAVNISAIRNPEHEQPTAARVALLDAELIYQNAPATSADALSATGEVFVQKSQQGGGSPMIRGFAANRLLIVVDGVRMNNAIFRAGNLQNVISIDPLALEGAQVIFGPGSVVYGSDALGGVMAFETLKPVFGKVDSIHVDAKAISRYSSANQGLMGQVQAKVGNGQWASVTSGSYNAFGDLRMGRHGPTDWQRTFFVERRNNEDLAIPNPEPNLQVGSGYRQVNLMQKVAYRPNDSWDFQYAFHLSTTNDIPRYDRLIEVQQAQPRHAEWHYGPQEWMLNQLSINGRRASTLYDELHINLAHQRFGEGRINRRFGSDDRFNREERVQAYSAIIDLNKRLGSSGLLDYGIEWVHNDVRTSGYQENINTGLRASVLPRLPDSEWASYAAFAAFRQKWLGGHTLQIGLRYNAFSMHSRFDTTMIALPFAEASLFNAAPAGSIGYSFTQGEWRYEALATTGFRAPNVDDVGKVFDSEPGSVTVPNAALRPEQAWNAELGLSYHADRAPQFHLSAYYTYLDGAMVRRNSTLNGQDSILYEGVPSQVQQLQNAAYAEVYGVQARLEWMLPGGWQLRSSFNWQRGTEVDNEGLVSPARHAAPWFGLSRIGYSHKGFYLEINAMYSGGFSYEQLAIEERGKPFLYARDAEGRPYSPSWYTLNFRSNYQLDAHWRFDFGVENLSDQRYRSYSSGIAGPGRNWIVGVARSW